MCRRILASTGNTWREREWWWLGGIYDNRHTHKREIALHHAHKNSPLKKFPFNIFSTVIRYPGFCFTAMLIVECTYRKKCVCKREREREREREGQKDDKVNGDRATLSSPADEGAFDRQVGCRHGGVCPGRSAWRPHCPGPDGEEEKTGYNTERGRERQRIGLRQTMG